MSGLRHCPPGPRLENGRPPACPRPERVPPLVSWPGNPRWLVPAATLATTKPPGRACPGRVAARRARPATGPMLTTPVPWARRLFGIKCAKCQVGFSSSDLVMRARDSVYHIECFRCSVCSRQLLPGDEFSLREHELLCRADHGLLLERAAAGSPRSPGPLPGARGLHLPGKPLAAGTAPPAPGCRAQVGVCVLRRVLVLGRKLVTWVCFRLPALWGFLSECRTLLGT